MLKWRFYFGASMSFVKTVLLFFYLSLQLHAITLQENYETKGRDIYASDISKDVEKDFLLFSYDDDKHMFRTSAEKVIAIFKVHGVQIKKNDVRYINFREKSRIDIDKITDAIKKEFLNKYPTLKIKSLRVYPRSFLTKLPKTFSLSLQKQTLYKNYSTFSIITPDHKMIFFDYILDANLDVVVTTKAIKRHEKISFDNTQIKTIKFLNFKADPLSDISNHQYQSKFALESENVLTQNDIEFLSIVRRDDHVNAFIEDGGVSITLDVVAEQDGKEGDIIAVRKLDGKKLRAKVVGLKRVEIQ
jgi:flagella basal body P-ring formation protein FlgA